MKKDKKYPYALLIARLFGFDDPLTKEQQSLFIRARKFFNEVQLRWKNKIVEKSKEKLKDDRIINMADGGTCSTFELIEHLIKCLEKSFPHLLEAFISHLVPDSVWYMQELCDHTDNSEDNKASLTRAKLDYVIMRIIYRI